MKKPFSRKRGGLKWVAGKRTPAKVYITRVFNFGTCEEWREIKRRFHRAEIEGVVRHPLRGQWTKRGKAFAETLFDCRMPASVLISYDAETAF